MPTYEKIYLRENSLVALQIWDEHQTIPIKNLWGQSYPPFIWDVTEGVAATYAETDTFNWVQNICAQKSKDPQFISSWLKKYEEQLSLLEPIWKKRQALKNHHDLLNFCDLVTQAWLGLEVSYFAPMLPEDTITAAERSACLDLRGRAAGFLDDSDHIIIKTLQALYPTLNDLVRFVSLNELRTQQIPSATELTFRSQHFILFAGEIHTHISLQAFLKTKNITLKEKKPQHEDELTGQIAMPGKVSGRAYVLLKKSEVHQVQEGDILISGMTVPDYLPAMKKAAGYVTDEGGVTCHAAIVAREFAKPCVIGTKFATQLIKTGDWIQVDADTGKVNIIKT